MAAGRGSRYGGAKQLDEVGPGGETLLDYAVFDARRVGFSRVVIVTRDDLLDAWQTRTANFPADLDVRCAVQGAPSLADAAASSSRRRPWGTVHAVLSAKAPDDAPVVALNADDFYGRTAYERAWHASERASTGDEASMIAMPLGSTLSEHGPVVRAVCEGHDGLLTRLEEIRGVVRKHGMITGQTPSGRPRALYGDELVSMNMWVLPAPVMRRLAASFRQFLDAQSQDAEAELPLPEAIGDLVARGLVTVRIEAAPGPWFGLTHADDRAGVVAALDRLTNAGAYPRELWRA